MKIKLLLATVLVLILIQFFPIERTNPPVDTKMDIASQVNVAPDVLKLMKDACYDCHSHETKFPSYTKYQPLGWWIRGHIRGGRMKVNFSDWGLYDEREKIAKAEKCAEVMEEGRMPLGSYARMHPEAKLTDAQINQLIQFFKNI